MARIHPKDSRSASIRAIERWKRGATGLIMVALVAGATTGLVAAAILLALEWVGVEESWQGVVIVIVALVIAPWAMGHRPTLHAIGQLAEVPDN